MIPRLLGNAYFNERLMTRLTNTATGNVLPPLLIESAVTVGRTAVETKRSGVLGLQEKLFEEISAAVVWLYGVKWISKGVKSLAHSWSRRNQQPEMALDVDWSKSVMGKFLRPGSKSSLAMTQLEAVSPSFKMLRKTMGVKSFLLLISVGIPLALTGYVIPKLNQFKTKTILKHLHDKETLAASRLSKSVPLHANGGQPYGTSVPASILPHNSAQGYGQPAFQDTIPRHPNVSFVMQNGISSTNLTHAVPVSHYSGPCWQPWINPSAQAVQGVPLTVSRLQFAGLGNKAIGAVSKLGHFIENTDYGTVLAIDVGITGGRVGTSRDFFEGLEYFMRDTLSLIFYLCTVPWGMTIADKWLKNKATVKLDGQVANRIGQELLRKLDGKAVTRETFDQLLNGTAPTLSPTIRNQVKSGLTSMSSKALIENISHELHAVLPADADRVKKIMTALERQIAGKGTLKTSELEALVQAVWQKGGTFSALNVTDTERFHLSKAVKQAFAQQGGLLETDFARVLGQASTRKANPLWNAHLRHLATIHRDQSLSNVLRNSLNHLKLSEKISEEALKPLEMLSNLAEKTIARGETLGEAIPNQLRGVVTEFEAYAGSLSSRQKAKPFYAAMEKSVALIKNVLNRSGQTFTQQEITDLKPLAAQFIENGRTWPNGFMWLQGRGLKHLGNVMNDVHPLLLENAPLSKTLTLQIEKHLYPLAHTSGLSTPIKKALQYQTSLLRTLLNGAGRLRLPVSELSAGLDTQIQEMLKGGLKNDRRFYQALLDVLKWEPEKLSALKPHVDTYLGRISALLSKKPLALGEFAESILKPLARSNNKWRYIAWGSSLGLSMIGVGWLIPRMQVKMTQRLSGKYQNPGITVAEKEANRHNPAYHHYNVFRMAGANLPQAASVSQPV